MTLQLDIVKVAEAVEETARMTMVNIRHLNVSQLSSKLDALDGSLSLNVALLSSRLDGIAEQITELSESDTLNEESQNVLSEIAKKVSTNQQTVSAVTQKIPELEAKLNHMKMTRTSAANELTDKVLDNVEELAVRVEQFNVNISSLTDNVQGIDSKLDRFRDTFQHNEQVQSQQYQLLTNEIKESADGVTSELETYTGIVDSIKDAQIGYTGDLEKIANNIKFFEYQLAQFSILNDDNDEVKANLTILTQQLADGITQVNLEITNLSKSDAAQYEECKSDFSRLNSKMISNTNSLENFRRDIRSYSGKLDRLTTADDDINDEIYKVQLAQGEVANQLRDAKSAHRQLAAKVNRTISTAITSEKPTFDESGFLSRINNLYAKKTELNDEVRAVRNRLTAASVSIKSIIEDSYSLLNSKIGSAEEKIENSTRMGENFRRSLFTTVDDIDKRLETNLLKIDKLDTEHVRLNRREITHFNQLNSTEIGHYEELNAKINNLIQVSAETNTEVANALKDEFTAIIGTVAKESGSNLNSIESNKNQIDEIDQTVKNIQRAMNVQLQKINNLSKVEATRPAEPANVRAKAGDVVSNES